MTKLIGTALIPVWVIAYTAVAFIDEVIEQVNAALERLQEPVA